MTVETTLSKKIYHGNGVVRDFPVPFRVVDAASLHLLITDGDNHELPVNGNFKVLMRGGEAVAVRYPLSGPPLPEGKRLTIYRRVPRTQPVNLTNAGAFHPDELERMGFDRIVMMVQELQEQTDRAVAVQISEEGKTPAELLDGIYKAAADATTANEESKVVLEEAKAAAGDVVEASERVQEAARKVEEVAGKTTEMAAKVGPLPAGTELLWPGKTPPVGWIDASLNHGPLLRNTETWGPLWQFAESSGNIIAEDAWLGEVARLGFCAAYSYGDGETTFRAPLLRKGFARAADPEAGLAVGAGHGDAIRNITGTFLSYNSTAWVAAGAFTRTGTYAASVKADWPTATNPYTEFNADNVVPTAEENRPVGYVRLPIIKVFDTVYQPGTVEIQDLMNQLGAVANLVNSPRHLQEMIFTQTICERITRASMPDYAKRVSFTFNTALLADTDLFVWSVGGIGLKDYTWALVLSENGTDFFDVAHSVGGYQYSTPSSVSTYVPTGWHYKIIPRSSYSAAPTCYRCPLIGVH